MSKHPAIIQTHGPADETIRLLSRQCPRALKAIVFGICCAPSFSLAQLDPSVPLYGMTTPAGGAFLGISGASPPANPASTTFLASDAVGGEVDVVSERKTAGGSYSLEVNGFITNEISIANSVTATSKTKLTFDGQDGNATVLDPTGLGGLDLSGNSEGFTFEYVSDGSPVSPMTVKITFDLYSDAGNWSRQEQTIVEGLNSVNYIPISFPRSGFVTQAGGGVSFSNLGAICITIDTITNGVDANIRKLRMPAYTLPADCMITDLAATANGGSCNDNGTPNDTTDDYYTGNVTVTFSDKPATGNLVLSGLSLHSTNTVSTVAVGSTTSATSHTFTGVRMKANGTANALTATFSEETACTMTVNAPTVAACSTPPPECLITAVAGSLAGGVCNDNGTPGDVTDDYFQGTVTVNFSNKPATGNLVLSGLALHSTNSVTTVAVGSTTTGNSHTFTGVRMKANGAANALTATFSADTACTMTVNAPTVAACSTPPPECLITTVVASLAGGACNDNGTPEDSADDYYLGSVTVNFSNKPATGNLVLSGAALHSTNSLDTVAVGSTTTATSHTFAGVRLKANGAANALTATFSADTDCTMTVNAETVPSCSVPPVECCPQIILGAP